MGEHIKATSKYQGALDALPALYRRDRGVYLARQALSHAHIGDIDHAAALGIRAVDIATITGSHRITADLSRLAREFNNHPCCTSVADFREAFSTVA